MYQTNGSELSYFSEDKGKSDTIAAVDAAIAHRFTKGITIYFAVDFDAQDHETSSYILDYFKGVSSKMKYLMRNYYKVGVYGARNVYSRVSEAGYAETSFVSGMSTGFSGNLGFLLPKNWAFDQISTITIRTGDGKIEIDNNIMSNRYKGEKSINPALAIAVRKYAGLMNKIPLLEFSLADLVLEKEIPVFDMKVVKGSVVISDKFKKPDVNSQVFEVKNGQIESKLGAEAVGLLGNLSPEYRLKSQNITQELALSVKNGNIETKTTIDGAWVHMSAILNYENIEISEGLKQDLSIELKLSFLNLNDVGEK
ncbi:glycoside hydrolase domain-containing protein [Bacillus sp. JAS24-2]|uniref:glycoside hydrolase domain-containing protein n=1 Tax=Bacillus sp. JAS24-2 TaxID=2217832 RepID=UPI002107E850|nr:glycoside hydrolase domain-containing protein [Bacillus sp. JAS24-2]